MLAGITCLLLLHVLHRLLQTKEKQQTGTAKLLISGKLNYEFPEGCNHI